MRSLLLVTAVLAFVGCNGGQPRIYRVAIDDTSIKPVSVAQCWLDASSAQQGNLGLFTNYFSESEWVIWGGVQGVEYLDLGEMEWTLGNSQSIKNYGIIQGKERAFTGSRNWEEVVSGPNPSGDMVNYYTHRFLTSVTVSFDNYSFSPTGGIDLRSEYVCVPNSTNCPQTPLRTSCNGSLSFVARLIDAENVAPVNNNPTSGEK